MNTTDVRTTHTLIGLRPQTNYDVTVKAYTIAGSGEERSVIITTEAICECSYIQCKLAVL